MDLRLLLWPDCNRNCAGCCNKNWDLGALPKASLVDIAEADMIMLTGGEPMLFPDRVRHTILAIRLTTDAPIYVYTAKVDNITAMEILMMADGMTLTLHCQADVESFRDFYKNIRHIKGKSLRLNVFKGIDLTFKPEGWIVKDNIEWIEDCPLPTNERFMRI